MRKKTSSKDRVKAERTKTQTATDRPATALTHTCATPGCFCNPEFDLDAKIRELEIIVAVGGCVYVKRSLQFLYAVREQRKRAA